MEQRSFFRFGAGCAMAGATLGIVFNLLHPRSSDAVDSTRAELEMVANSGIWTLVHVMLGIALALGLVGLIAIALSMAQGRGELWAWLAALAAVAGVAITWLLVAVDGIAVKQVADEWAGASDQAAVVQAASILMNIDLGLLVAAIGSHFGLSAVLFGVAILVSGVYARGLGYASIAAGALGLVTAIAMAFSGGDALTLNVLFPIASLVDTAVLFLLGWQLWRRGEAPVSEPAVAPIAA